MQQQPASQDELRFELLAEIAMGATARVELSRVAGGARAGDLVAVKRLLPHIAEDQQFVDMFRDEVWMTSALKHDHVVEVVGWGQDTEGPWLAVELVRGVSLQRLMKTVFETRERFTERMIVYTARCVCDGLVAAHSLHSAGGEHLNLVHRDLTPGNILLGFDGQVKITDFGLAKAKQRLTKTLTGLLKGKPSYMSPEQVNGKELDGRSDIFALGVVLYEMFSGRRPWRVKTDLDAMRAITDEPAMDLLSQRPRLDSALAEIVHRCLEKRPEDRFQTAAELQERFDHWLLAHGYRSDNVSSLARFVRRNAMRQMRWFERATNGELAKQAQAENRMHRGRGRSLAPPRVAPPPPPSLRASVPLAKAHRAHKAQDATRNDIAASAPRPAAPEARTSSPSKEDEFGWEDEDDGPTLIKKSEKARQEIQRSIGSRARSKLPTREPTTQRARRKLTDQMPVLEDEKIAAAQHSETAAAHAAAAAEDNADVGDTTLQMEDGLKDDADTPGVLAPPDPSVPPPPTRSSSPPAQSEAATNAPVTRTTAAFGGQGIPLRQAQGPAKAPRERRGPEPLGPTAKVAIQTASKVVTSAPPVSVTDITAASARPISAMPAPRFPSLTGMTGISLAPGHEPTHDPRSEAFRLGEAAKAAGETARVAARIAQAAAQAASLAGEAAMLSGSGRLEDARAILAQAQAIDACLRRGEVPDMLDSPPLGASGGPPALAAMAPVRPMQPQVQAVGIHPRIQPDTPLQQLITLVRTREGAILIGAIVVGGLLFIALLIKILA